MGSQCCGGADTDSAADPAYRRVLYWALAINLGMFFIEIGAGLLSGSVSLQADALDFLGDAGNYGISLVVVGMALKYRAGAALIKGSTMGLFGLWVAGSTVWHIVTADTPDAMAMGIVGFTALMANVATALMLFRYRKGDSNMRSVWVCSRNDAIGNVAVMLAALGVFGTASRWPDIAVAAVMAGLALSGAWSIIRHARADLAADREAEQAAGAPAE